MLTRTGAGLLAGAALLYAGGWALGDTELIAVAAAALLAVGVGIAWVIARPAVRVRREIHPERVERTGAALGVVEVANPGRRPTPPLTAVEAAGSQRLRIAIPRLAAGERRRVSYPLPTARRGVFAVGPLVVSRTDPFGAVRSTKRYGDVTSLVVHPRVHALPLVPAGRDRSLDGPRVDAATGNLTFHALRPYVQGDDLRFVHWRSTARMGTLIVREQVDTSRPETVVVLDTEDSRYDQDSFEEAAEAAASVVVSSARARCPVQLLTTSGLSVGGRGPRQRVDAYLDALAAVECLPSRPLAEVVNRSRRGHRARALVAVTGTAGLDELRFLTSARRRFDRLTVVRLLPAGPTAAVGWPARWPRFTPR